MTEHHFQTPQVQELVIARDDVPQSPVLLTVAPADAERILRALDDASLMFTPTNGANGATAYRRLAADVRKQARLAPEAWQQAFGHVA